MVNLGNDWDEILKDEFQKDYYRNLRKFLADEYRKCVVYPNMYDIFNALRYTSFENTRAVILGQDPYHGPGQAHGMCFSVKKGVPLPPSLKNIFRELADEGAAVLLITHDLELALEVADRVSVFYQGESVEEITPEEFRRPETLEHPFTRALWQAMQEE